MLNQKGLASLILFIGVFVLVLTGVGFVVYRNIQYSRPVNSTSMNSSSAKIDASSPSISPSSSPKASSDADHFITSLPINLDQVESISKYRSCTGHDYSGLNIEGENETTRSMKNYILPVASLRGTVNKIQIFAPFDGKMVSIQDDAQVVNVGKQLWLSPDVDPTWIFVYFHITPIVKVGDSFKAGQLIGYANLKPTEDFDVTLKRFVDSGNKPITLTQVKAKFPNFDQMIQSGTKPTGAQGDSSQNSFGMNQELDSVFNHMSSQVLADFAQKGITPQNIIITKEQRDASPCKNFSEPYSTFVALH